MLTASDPTLGVETLTGVLGTVTVSGGSAGVVTVTLGRIVLSAPALAGTDAETASPSIPTTANRRKTNLAPLSRWLPIRRLSASPC